MEYYAVCSCGAMTAISLVVAGWLIVRWSYVQVSGLPMSLIIQNVLDLQYARDGSVGHDGNH